MRNMLKRVLKQNMVKDLLTPDYIFEASWEVCNKVGGIYTVLSTRANTLQKELHDRIFFIGPDIWKGKENPLFIESAELYADWKRKASTNDHLSVRIGRWDIPGSPIAFLIDFQHFFAQKNDIYTEMWNSFQVDSLHAYGDYDEASMFAYAAGKTVESFYRYNLNKTDKVVFQAHEWMTGMGALYLKKYVPEIATIFTTHATSIGRSIAGNNKPLYHYFYDYNGDQMAQELNMQSKHSIEKQTAHFVDCFTTVSEITNKECKQLLEKSADVILMNGFEDDFVPKGRELTRIRRTTRTEILNIANKLLGTNLTRNTLIVGTSGRYEFKNKGIDLFLEALALLNDDSHLKKEVLAFITVPAWVKEPRKDLQEVLENQKENNQKANNPLDYPFITHWLHNMQEDRILATMNSLGIKNLPTDRVKVIFVPCYLDGTDGIFNMSYYEFLSALDLTVYPSYYEPWGYTPLESVAFRIPTITTNLSGFGLWAESLRTGYDLKDGIEVLGRTDTNYATLANTIKKRIASVSKLTDAEVTRSRRLASLLAEKALWKHFISYYYEAYDVALIKAIERHSN